MSEAKIVFMNPECKQAEPKSFYYENEKYLLDTIMQLLKINRDDLDKDPSWIKARVRDFKIDEIIN